MGEYQKCPICNGVGLVSGGYFDRAGDCEMWATSNTNAETCRVCSGSGIIERPRDEVKEE